MSEAFRCDACGKYETGVPARLTVNSIYYNYPTSEEADLCNECLGHVYACIGNCGKTFGYENKWSIYSDET